jgi:hypothetical protein
VGLVGGADAHHGALFVDPIRPTSGGGICHQWFWQGLHEIKAHPLQCGETLWPKRKKYMGWWPSANTFPFERQGDRFTKRDC